MKINVPLITQPKGSVDCGIAGITMVINYYGQHVSFEEVKEKIAIDAVGTYIPQLGLYLMSRGFDVTIVTQHPSIFTNNDTGMYGEEILKRVDSLLLNNPKEQNRKVLEYFKKFLEEGGKIEVKIPDEKDIVNELKEHRPVGAAMTTNFIYGNSPAFNSHFNIITGIDENYIYVNDSSWNECGGKKKYEKKDFFYGLYASAYGDLDNASLMIIKPKDL
jgi:hypothetical protein